MKLYCEWEEAEACEIRHIVERVKSGFKRDAKQIMEKQIVYTIPAEPSPEVAELERWGIEWREGDVHACKQMPDGYWTPWHTAATALAALDRRVKELEATRDHWLRETQRVLKAGQEAMDRNTELEAVVMAVVAATRAYLPPDGIDAKECVSRILGATDNPAINPIIADIEARAALGGSTDDQA